MEMYDWLYTTNAAFNEKLTTELFDTLDIDGPIVVVLDGQENAWVGDEERFAATKVDKAWLEKLCGRVADGDEPVVSQYQNCGVIISALRTHKRNCGYIAIILQEHSPEATLTKLELAEAVMALANRLACVLEENESLNEMHHKLSLHTN